jgi:putative endonuclease
MGNRKKLGNQGELLAITYLEQEGYQLIERNYRIGRGEIDIIAIRKDLLVFAEVKTSSHQFRRFMVEDRVSWYQRQKIKETAYRYLDKRAWTGTVRFDVLMVYPGIGVVQHFKAYFGQL